MRDRTLLVVAHHVEHSLDDFLAHGVTHNFSHDIGSSLLQKSKDGTKLFNRPDAQHACSADLSARLRNLVNGAVTTSQDHHTVVAEISKVCRDSLESLLFLVLEETVLLLDELCDDLGQEVKGILLVLCVGVSACHC